MFLVNGSQLTKVLTALLFFGLVTALAIDGPAAPDHANAGQMKTKKPGTHATEVSTAVAYVNAMVAGSRVAVGRLDFACQLRILSASPMGQASFPKKSDPVYDDCWRGIEAANAEAVDRLERGMNVLWPGKGRLVFFAENLNRHQYAASAFVSPAVGKVTRIKIELVDANKLGFASFRLSPQGEMVGAPATIVQLRITYLDPLAGPVMHASGSYQWASTVMRPREAVKSVTLRWIVLSDLKKLGFPADRAVLNLPAVAATPKQPAVPFLTKYSGYVKDSAARWTSEETSDLLVAAVGRSARFPELKDRVGMLNRVLIIDPDQAEALTALTRDLYQAILDDGAAAHQVQIEDRALAARFTEFYWDTYAEGARIDISLDMEMGGFTTPTTADYLFRMIPAMERLATLRPDDLENRFRLGVAYRWNLDQLTAIETHAALVKVLPAERPALRARALTELAWSRITKTAFNRTYGDPDIQAAFAEAEEAFQLSDRPMDKFVAAYTMAYSLCYTPDRDNRKILELLTEAKRWYLQIPGSSEQSWRVLLSNDTLKPVIDADPELQQLVVAGDRG